jgi:hypothetical protein
MPTFDTRGPITAVVALILGEVRISAGERATTTVAVNPSDAADAEDVQAAQLTRVEYGEGRLLVKAPRPRSWLGRKGGSVDVAIELSAGSDLIGHAASGDFRGDGRLGDCRIKLGLGQVQLDEVATLSVKSGAGDVSVRRVTRRAEVATGTGDIRVEELGDGAEIKNSNGDTWVGTAHGDLRVRSANGSLAVGTAHGGVSAKSANGDIRLGDVARGSVAVETHAGDLEVGIRAGTAAWLDLNAGAGRVHNGLEAADRPDAEADTVEVRARTSIGDIVVQRA